MKTLPEYLAKDRNPGNRDAFLAYAQEAQEQFRPASFLELHFAAEIVRDTWRSSLIARISEDDYCAESMEALRRSRDRLNAEIRRNTGELRRLQTDRILSDRANLDLPVPAATRDILRVEQKLAKRTAASKPTAESKGESAAPEPIAQQTAAPEPAAQQPAAQQPTAPAPAQPHRTEPQSTSTFSLAAVEALIEEQFARMEREERAEYARSTGRQVSVPLNSGPHDRAL